MPFQLKCSILCVHYIVPVQKRDCGPSCDEKFCRVVPRFAPNAHTAGFGGKAVKSDNPTGITWNDKAKTRTIEWA